MKWLFAGIFAVLVLVSLGVYASLPGNAGPTPVLYWVTDRNPAREQQVAIFQAWLREAHPDVKIDLRLDMGQGDYQKQVVQGVSGVAGDLIDVYGGGTVRYMNAVGIAADVTDAAAARGFGPDATFPALREDVTETDPQGRRRQYVFPCNVANTAFFVNLDTIEHVGMTAPPAIWTVGEFERYGREYARKANAPGTFADRRPRFLADSVDIDVLTRSYGTDLFDETLTGPALDQRVYTPAGLSDTVGFAAALGKVFEWTNGPDRFLPAQSDLDAMSSGGGYGGLATGAFVRGDYALYRTGRWGLIQFREVNRQRVDPADYAALERGELGEAERRDITDAGRSLPLRLAIAGSPYQTLANVGINARSAMVYSGGKNQDLALYFLEFLASKPYNDNIIADADGLPPVPAYARGPDYLRPAVDPRRGVYAQTEWAVHAPLLRDAETLAIPNGYSPFVLYTIAFDDRQKFIDEVMSRVRPPGEAARLAADRVRRRFDESLARLEPDDPRRTQYARWRADQERIDAIKARGGKIPAGLIRNPYYLKYYESIGMLDGSAAAGGGRD